MTKRALKDITMKRLLYLVFIGSAITVPAAAYAELKGELTLGAGILEIDGESFKHGEYTGLTDDGLFGVAAADLDYDRGLYYLDLKAADLGLDSRSVFLQSGKLRGYNAFISYSELPHFISNNSRTPFENPGSSDLTLPAGFVRSSATTGMTNLQSSLKDVELRLNRAKWALGLSDRFGAFSSEITYSHETKDGLKSLGGALGTSGGSTRSIVLPEPVDYTTDELRAALAYQGQVSYARFEYLLSLFSNRTDSVTWDNPFNPAGYPTEARTSLPPDNMHQRFSLSGGATLPFYNTRVSALAEYGIMEQDEDLLPYSNNPSSTVTVPVPRATAQAEIDTYTLLLNLSSRPVPRLGMNLRYRYYATDNKTPRDLFRYVKNDQGAAQAALTDANALYNLPYDYTQNKLGLEGSYYLVRSTTLRAGYDYELVERDFREIKKTVENTVRASIQSQYFESTGLGMNASYASRNADDPYSESHVYDFYHTEEYIATQAANVRFDNHPLMRKFDIADRDRLKVGASATRLVGERATVAAYYDFSKDDYGESELGLTSKSVNRVTLDAAWSPTEELSLHAFYTKEISGTEQDSRQYNGNASKAAQSADEGRNWSAKHDDDIDTAGFGASLGLMENRLTLGADYSFTESTTRIKFVAGSALAAAQDMPPIYYRVHSIGLNGKYRLNRNVSVGARYGYENYESSDWQTSDVPPGSSVIANVITLSGPTGDYEAHNGIVFVTYSFGAEEI